MRSGLVIGLIFSLCSVIAQATPLAVDRVDDGIYVHHGVHQDLSDDYHGDISNLSFIVGSKGIAVVDTGGSFNVGQQLFEAIREVSPLPILYVINTHIHPDHIFGNAAFEKEPAQFVGHHKLPDAMELRRDSYMRINQQWLGDAFAGSKIIKPTILVNQETTLDLGDRKLIIKAYPVAHTTTDITVFDDKTQTLWTGDLLIAERTPSLDGDIKGWIAILEKMGASNIKQMIFGHGGAGEEKLWKSHLAKHLQYLNVLLSDVRASIKKGEVMESSMNTAATSEKKHWVLFDIVNRRNVNNLYPSLEWE